MITCLKGLYTVRLNELKKRLAASGTQNAETEPDQKEVDVPPDLVATLKDDLKWWEEDDDARVGECLKDLKENVRATGFYLTRCDVTHSGHATTKHLPHRRNRPQQAALLVEGINCLATANSGPILLYIRSGNG